MADEYPVAKGQLPGFSTRDGRDRGRFRRHRHLALVSLVSRCIPKDGVRSASLRSVVVFAACIFLLMKPWTDGRGLFRKKIQAFRLSPELFASSTVVFLTLDPKGVPKALLHNLKHNRVLHERTIILSVQTRDEPYVDEPYVDEPSRIEIVGHEQGIWHVILHFGYSETPDVPTAIAGLSIPGFEPIESRITYFLGREAIVVGREGGGMMKWRKRLFTFMFNNAVSPADFFRLPPDRVVEIGAKTAL